MSKNIFSPSIFKIGAVAVAGLITIGGASAVHAFVAADEEPYVASQPELTPGPVSTEDGSEPEPFDGDPEFVPTDDDEPVEAPEPTPAEPDPAEDAVAFDGDPEFAPDNDNGVGESGWDTDTVPDDPTLTPPPVETDDGSMPEPFDGDPEFAPEE